ncbi:MAG: Glu-tRNA(Gln) amidotransferase subunit GatE [Candidatus Thermoplasmatota archaeon]|nr:Glu-tRNA(Gln) amidotransferase subunit GatE [Candidatus Thermoplasmatota archaeon]
MGGEKDHEDIGLKVGLEIHQQLNTDKLFCGCPSEMVEDEGKTVLRNLRPTASELGEVDRAALMEAQKGLKFRYQAPERSTCLVELDEEPPSGPDQEALDVALTMALYMDANIMDEIQFMRKIVIDGSNTAGFQRTGLIAMNGSLEVNGKEIGIPTMCLEEDAARSIDEKDGEKVYRLDRLGIPLVEIATDPDMTSPEEAKEVAQTIGGLFRGTRKVKRGIGSIREDLNVSIEDGARVEMKGVQELNMLPEYVKKEVERQLSLLDIEEVLEERDAEVEDEIYDVTEEMEDSESGLIQSNIEKGKGVYALSLRGFSRQLRGEDNEPLLGPELAQYARKTGVAGIFHSDELPKYGITKEKVEDIEERLQIDEKDAFVLVTESEENAREALERVIERANMALKGVPEETRQAKPDGTSVFLRPLSGEARMYPETDISPEEIDQSRLERLEEELPERPDEKIERFQEEYDLNEQQSEQLFKKGYDVLFEKIVEKYGKASVVADTFLQTYPDLKKDGYEPGKVGEDKLLEIFRRLDSKEFAKEGISELLKEICEGRSVEEGIESAGLKTVDEGEIREKISEIVEDRIDFVKEREMGAVGPLMGVVMEDLKGKADGEKVSKILREEIQKRI